jgi:hypothetical protein
MESLRTRYYNIEHTLEEMGYSEQDYTYKYVIKLRDIIVGSSANNRDRNRMLKYLQHLIHRLPDKSKEFCPPVIDENPIIYRIRWHYRYRDPYFRELNFTDIYAPSVGSAIERFRSHIMQSDIGGLKRNSTIEIKSIEKASFTMCDE